MSSLGVSDSQFYMWRTLFAIAHADHVVTDEEVRFMADAMEDVSFSTAQHDVLKKDTVEPQNIEKMYAGITDVRDQAVFFKFAHELVHIDGDYGADEQKVMLRLQELHVHATNVDELIGDIELELDADISPDFPSEGGAVPVKAGRMKGVLFSFRKYFLGR